MKIVNIFQFFNSYLLVSHVLNFYSMIKLQQKKHVKKLLLCFAQDHLHRQHLEVGGAMPISLLEEGHTTVNFYSREISSNGLRLKPLQTGTPVSDPPGTRNLHREVLKCKEKWNDFPRHSVKDYKQFSNLMTELLKLDPRERATSVTALKSEFLIQTRSSLRASTAV